MNIYTVTQESLAELERVGTVTAVKIVEKRNLVIEGQHDPIMVQHLSAIRLSKEYWQSLIDKNVISLEVLAEITLKPRSPTAEKEIAEAERHEETDYEKIENMLDKSLKISFNRMENKLDTNSNH